MSIDMSFFTRYGTVGNYSRTQKMKQKVEDACFIRENDDSRTETLNLSRYKLWKKTQNHLSN